MTALAEPGAAARERILLRSPHRRILRSLLEISDLRAEQQHLVAAALARARRDRPLRQLLRQLERTTHDLGEELDGAGLAIGQLEALSPDAGTEP
jgi:hypothetical protein